MTIWIREERIRDIQTRLSTLQDQSGLRPAPFYQGAINGQLDGATHEAITRYQRQAGLIANGQINLELFRSLKNPPPAAISSNIPVSIPAPVLNFELEGGMPVDSGITFARNSKLVLGLRVNRDSYAQCFLKNHDDQVYRIFPTTEQQDDRLQAGRVTYIPQSSVAQIDLNSPTTNEEVGCIVSSQALAAGAQLPLSPLGAMSVPNARSLQQVLEQYQRFAGNTALALKVLRFEVN